MKKLKSILILVMLIGGPLATWAQGGQSVGSGGDALRQLMDQARWAGLGRLSALDWCSFAPSTSPELSKWILQRVNDFKHDLQSSNHLWVVDAQATCGFTQHSSSSDIYFSYPTCAATVGNNVNLALFTLLHETAHHLGVHDERQADQVARVIMDADIAIKCPAVTQDVFNPLVCQGPVFSSSDAAKYIRPGQSSTDPIGNYQGHARSRQCNYLNGCGAWAADAIMAFSDVALEKLSFTLATELKPPFFETKIMGGFLATTAYRPYDIRFATGIPGALKLDVTNWSTNSIFNSKVGSIVRQAVGEIRQNCAWFQVQRRTQDMSNGTYIESEIVVYGQH